MEKNPYRSFEKYVLRTPLLPLSLLMDLTKEQLISEDRLKQLYDQNKSIQEAVFLASPILHNRLEKWLVDEITDPIEPERITYSFLKYLSRMCSRCTPFGLFAGTALGHFAESSKVELELPENFKRHTRLDMNYLIALSQNLSKKPSIKNQICFYPNSSLYPVANEWRYIEYHYKGNRRIHQTVSLENDDYLQLIINQSQQGAYLPDLIQLLIDDGFSTDEASQFIYEIVDSQLLVSELEPAVSGPEYFDQLMTCIEKLKGVKPMVDLLKGVQRKIKALDKSLNNSKEDYTQITDSLKELTTGFDLKYMFQTDMSLNLRKNTLSTSIQEKALKAMSLLVRITPPTEETFMSQFGKALFERFEDREIPLARALDVEVGIGYKQNERNNDVNYLIDDIIVSNTRNEFTRTLKLNSAQLILHKKLIKAITLQEHIIRLSDDDFRDFPLNWDDLPDTLSAMIQLINEEGEQKIVLSGFGGSSAINLLARFCHGDDHIREHAYGIVEKEDALNEDKLLAEIVHLPEARVGNVLMRPSFRTYEIPYLAKSILPVNQQITINDLVVSAKSNGTVLLRSVSQNKEVSPRLANAHNYSSQSLPIYHFLADLQTQGKRMPVFSWGGLAEAYSFLPRVEYEGIILSKACWKLSKKDIQKMLKVVTKDSALKEEIDSCRQVHRLPQYVLLIEGDNELLINMHNLTSVRMLLKEVKNRAEFKLSEFLFGDETVVKQGTNEYTNQFHLAFYITQKSKIKI